MIAAEMGAQRRRLDDGLDDRGVGVTQEEGAVPEVVVDVAMPVDVPLVGALSPRDVGREWQRVAHVVAERAADRLLGPRVQRPRPATGRLDLVLEAPRHDLVLSTLGPRL